MNRHALSASPVNGLSLAADEVNVWIAVLDRSPEEVAALQALLSADELDRTARIHSPRTRVEFAVGRGLLRTLLASYLGVGAARIRFALGPAGKPELREPSGTGLHFNVTHSHGLAMYAVTSRCPVGVDVEHLRPMSNYLGLAERYFSPREFEMLRSLPDEQRAEAFFHAWTRKEAFLKARGVGLSYGLERVEVTLGPQEPAQLLRLDGEERQARSWSLCNLEPAPGFVGALALERHDYRLICRDLSFGERTR
jgi:4'-phosphopantetheinyl transferase